MLLFGFENGVLLGNRAEFPVEGLVVLSEVIEVRLQELLGVVARREVSEFRFDARNVGVLGFEFRGESLEFGERERVQDEEV